MFGWEEVVLIVVLAVILLGPEKLADVARTLGRIYGEYQKAKRQLELELIYGMNRNGIEEITRKKLEGVASEFAKSVEELRRLSKP